MGDFAQLQSVDAGGVFGLLVGDRDDAPGHARTVAAYRDRYGITEDTSLGPVPENTARKVDRARAEIALR
ncbi:hypothetical protein GCM10022199_09530 [Marihabitans asiaticum]